jgi:hypothetical protein
LSLMCFLHFVSVTEVVLIRKFRWSFLLDLG